MNEEEKKDAPFTPLGQTAPESSQEPGEAVAATSFTFPTLGTLFSGAWNEYKKQWLQYSAAAIGAIALISIGYIIATFAVSLLLDNATLLQEGSHSPTMNAVVELLGTFITGWFMAGLSIVFINQVFRGQSSLSQLIYSPIHPLIAGIAILIDLVSTAGMILLIVPGIIVFLRYMFADYIAILKGTDTITSFTESARMTYGFGWKLFWYVVVIMLFGFSGILLLGVGLAITMPVSVIMHVLLYKALAAREIPQTDSEPSWLVRNVSTTLYLGAFVGLLVVGAGAAVPEEYFNYEYDSNPVEISPNEVEIEDNVV